MATVKLVLAFFLSLFQILTPVTALVVNLGEGNFFSEWSATDKFTADYCAEIEKTPDEDFSKKDLRANGDKSKHVRKNFTL